MRPVCSGDMYARVPSSRLALVAAWVSLDSRVAIPKSMILSAPVVEQEVMRLDVLVDDRAAWMRGDRARPSDRDVQELLQRRALVAEQRLERNVAEILEHQRHAPSVLDEPECANDLRQVERREERVLVPKARHLYAGRMFGAEQLHDHPSAVRVPRPRSRLALWVSRTVSVNV